MKCNSEKLYENFVKLHHVFLAWSILQQDERSFRCNRFHGKNHKEGANMYSFSRIVEKGSFSVKLHVLFFSKLEKGLLDLFIALRK